MYEIKNENNEVVLAINDKNGIEKLQKIMEKSIDEINDELRKNNYFTDKEENKYYLTVMFIDFEEENDE